MNITNDDRYNCFNAKPDKVQHPHRRCDVVQDVWLMFEKQNNCEWKVHTKNVINTKLSENCVFGNQKY